MTTKIALTNIADTALATLTGPKITTIVYPGTETATDTAGGETINLTGAGFQSGCSVLVASTAASVVSFISATQISFVAPALSAGTYVIYVINPDGGTAISIPGISYSGTPTWTTTAGSLGTAYEAGAISATLAATGDAPITYVLASGTLPTGSSLSSGGSLSGTAPATASITTYNFTITAKDAQNQTTNRAFSLTINPDVVSWSTPASLATYNVFTNSAIANVTMSATSASGGSITYTADTLPTGLSITGANIAGTPTVAASTTTVLTATATSTRTATRTINWVVSVANDTYFKNTTLLLNGETTVTPFISDASTNSFGLTIVGDTKPTLFSPYQGDGYYSTSFNGSTDYLTTVNTPANLGTSDFTVEGWFYFNTNTGGYKPLFTSSGSADQQGWVLITETANQLALYFSNGSSWTYTYVSSYVPTINTWTHIAVVRSGTTITLYANGTALGTISIGNNSVSVGSSTFNIGYYPYFPGGARSFNGYISNSRIVKGTAIYTSTFTPSTTPLTAIANTSLLTCQSNRFIDKSTNAYAITVNGSPQISPAIPFTQNASYSTYGSAYFDGSGDYLSTTLTGGLGSGDFTVEYWVYYTSFYNYITNISTYRGSTGWNCGTQASAQIVWYSSSAEKVRGTTAMAANTWHHVAFVRSSGTLKGYLNGVQDGTTSTETTAFSSTDMNIGRLQAGSPGEYITGYISNIRIVVGTAVYTTAFTPPTTPLTAITNTQLLTLQYNGGANNYGIIDNSNFNNIITQNGNATQGTFSPYSQTGWSLYTNGTSSYAYVPYSSTRSIGTGDFSIECWVYVVKQPADYTRIWSHQSNWGLSGNIGVELAFGSVDTLIQVLVDGNSTTYTSATLSDATLPWKNKWAHVVATRQNGYLRLFVNGVLREANTNTTNINGTSNTSFGTNSQLGGDLTETYISNFRMCIGSVPTSYSTTNTTGGTTIFTPPTSPLTLTSQGASNVTLLLFQSNRFVDNSPYNFAITTVSSPSIQAFGPFGSISEATPISYSNYFDGTGDYLTLASNTAFNIFNGDMTVECWFYATALANSPHIFAFVQDASNRESIYFNSSALTFYSTSGAGSGNRIATSALSLNTWYHMALVKSSTTFTLYLNGTSVGTSTTTQYSTSNQSLQIGTYSSGGYAGDNFNGYISNVRVVKGTAVYTTTFTPSTTPLTAIANTSLLTCQSTTMIDNSTNAFTITASGDTKPRIFNPFGYTAQSAASYTPSIHGGSAYFDGTGDYLTLPSNSVGAFGTGDFTIECWIYLSGSNINYRTIVSTRSSNGTTTGWCLATNASGDIYIYSGAFLVTASSAIVPSTWYHVAVCRLSGTTTLYLNGVSKATSSTARTYSDAGLSISADPYGVTELWQGYISDLRLIKGTAVYTSNFVPPTQTLTNYSTTTPASLLLNFNNGGIIDQHSTNVLENIAGAQLSTSIKKYNNSSLSFSSASSQYLFMSNKSLAFIFAGGDFTIELWVNISDTSGRKYILGPGTDTASHYKGFGLEIWGQQLCMWASSNGTSWDLLECDTSANRGSTLLSSGTWYHIAVTRNGNTYRSFVNGTIEKTFTVSGSIYSDSTIPYNIGRTAYQSGNFYYNGYMDDLRITKGYARYTSNFTAPTSALITK